jgi:DNA-binding transcriptional regulator YiaG
MKYYVYLHVNPITKAPFYIGKGCGRRAFDKTERNEAWSVINGSLEAIGLTYEVQILHICSSAQEAFDLERIEIILRLKAGQSLVNIFHKNSEVEPEIKSDLEDIPTYVRIKRQALGYSQRVFAERVGVGLRFLRELEQGKTTLRLDKINKVLGYLGGTAAVR